MVVFDKLLTSLTKLSKDHLAIGNRSCAELNQYSYHFKVGGFQDCGGARVLCKRRAGAQPQPAAQLIGLARGPHALHGRP